MYLKNIEVQGFKSFAQKINFEFHNGITGIVGPNGSGKSNVADAVRWVLGEQSAKQLRGGNMQDVIFSGTELRKPLSFASVAITLDNSDHKLPVEYGEVTVTRRLYRSGESEYLLNGSTCRLKDIVEMFYDTGIGKEGYSIIGQGQIDKILSGKPEDRRELFDEAAGIVKFKRRKNMTMKKLEEERQNLVRVTDILSELTHRLGPLERQSEAARVYLAKREELRELDVNYFLVEDAQTTFQLKELGEKEETARSELEEKQEEHSQIRSEYERISEELEKLDRDIISLREVTQQDALRRQELEGQIQVMEEQIASSHQSDHHHKNRLQTIREELEKRRQEQEQLKDEKSALKLELMDIRKSLHTRDAELKRLQDEILEASGSVEDAKNEVIELIRARSKTSGQVQRFEAVKEQLGIRKAQISQRILTLKTEEKEQAALYEEAFAAYQKISEKIQEKQDQCQRLEGSLAGIAREVKIKTGQLEQEQVAYHKESSRLETLRNITERYDGYGNSIRRVMEQKGKIAGIHGVVADLIHVKKDYEIAIETALGGSIQNIVTDTDQTAKQLIEYLKQNRFGRATFLPLSSISSRGGFPQKEALQEPGVIGVASDLVDMEDAYREVVGYLLGRVLVVDRMDHAIALGRKYRHSLRMVTLEGESFSPGGSMTGGAFKNNSNLLGRRREIEELEKSTSALLETVNRLNKEMQQAREKRNTIRDTITEYQEELNALLVEQNTAKMNLQQQEEKKKEITQSYEQITFDQEQIKRESKELTDNSEKLNLELAASKEEEVHLNKLAEEQTKRLEVLREKETGVSQALAQSRLQENALNQKDSFLQENLERLQSEIQSLETEEVQIGDALKESDTGREQKKKEIGLLREAIHSYENENEISVKQLGEWQKEREEQNKVQKTFFDKRDALSQEIRLLDKECFRLKSQMEKLEENREGRITYLWEEYEITPADAEKYLREDLNNRNALKKEIARLREEIKQLGSVNVNAIEEYKEVKERHSFLAAQHADLVNAEKTLMDAIQELDEGMRKQFTEKFRDIQREFDKAFKELFGGGRGTLELDEEADILEAGIRIISQPPGKKLQNMMQLSGGEKALTAIALLFAIQNLKPSPFCLLDEIEAALDDSNVGRFAGYLNKLTKNTQFIVITHRRGTMNAADRLYGITMQEKGVSTLVSVDLVENELSK